MEQYVKQYWYELLGRMWKVADAAACVYCALAGATQETKINLHSRSVG
jgi:hypothetical protein